VTPEEIRKLIFNDLNQAMKKPKMFHLSEGDRVTGVITGFQSNDGSDFVTILDVEDSHAQRRILISQITQIDDIQ